MHSDAVDLTEVFAAILLGDKIKKATGVPVTDQRQAPVRSDTDPALQFTQNILCFPTKGYEKPWSLNSMSGMSSKEASGVSSVSTLQCSPTRLTQPSHCPIPTIV